jgi:hypothetical protein
VTNFHQRNRVPRPPSPSRLCDIQQAGRGHNAGVEDADDESEPDSATESAQKTRAKRNSHKAYSKTANDPAQYRVYPMQWKKVLGKAQALFRLWMTMEYGYPNKNDADHQKAAGDCLRQAIFEHQENGGRVEEGTI